MHDLRSSLLHVGSLVAAFELLVAACGISFPDRVQTQTSYIGSVESEPLDHFYMTNLLSFIRALSS